MPRPSFTQVRAGILFVAGLGGVAYETLIAGAERPTLLILFGAMMGLPLFLKPDRPEVPAPPAVQPPTSPSADQNGTT